jgi:hypothetical protein
LEDIAHAPLAIADCIAPAFLDVRQVSGILPASTAGNQAAVAMAL